jgi:hypothetical protein
VSGFRVQGSGFKVQGSGFWVQDVGFQHSGLRVEVSGFRVSGSAFRVNCISDRDRSADCPAVSRKKAKFETQNPQYKFRNPKRDAVQAVFGLTDWGSGLRC